jgi:branched-chain amino acid transport system permease protein
VDLPLAFNSELATQLLVNGLTLGSLYALIALGYTMVYGILRLLNFAHGDVYMVGAFIGYGVLNAFGGPLSPNIAIRVLIPLMFLGGMLGSGALGVTIERFAYRPLRDAPRIAPLISALGVSFFIQNSVLLLLGADFRTYNSFLLGSKHPERFEPGPLSDAVFVVNGVRVQLVQILVLAMAVGLMVALTLLVARSCSGSSSARSTTSWDSSPGSRASPQPWWAVSAASPGRWWAGSSSGWPSRMRPGTWAGGGQT